MTEPFVKVEKREKIELREREDFFPVLFLFFR